MTDSDSASGSDTVLACPECDSSTIESNVVHGMKGVPARSKHRCNDCGHCFDEHDAVYRERKKEVPPRGDSIARTLHDADPDDLATDGGFTGDAMFPDLSDEPFADRPKGKRCQNCERLQHPDRDECPVCGGELVARE